MVVKKRDLVIIRGIKQVLKRLSDTIRISIFNFGFNFKSQVGYITILFCVLSILLAGGLYYNVSLATSVKNLIKLQNADDLSTYALGIKASKGLNYISVNNVSIASALHISSSIPILASYLTMIKASTQSSLRTGMDQAQAMYGKGGFQRIWDRLKPIVATYMKVAAGSTAFNKSIKTSWLGYSLHKAESIFKKNFDLKDSMIVFLRETPDQSSSMNVDRMYFKKVFLKDTKLNKMIEYGKDILNYRDKVSSWADFSYEGITQTSSSDTICKIFRASKRAMEYQRDAPFYWVSGVLPDNELSKAISKFNKYVGSVQKYVPYSIGYYGCGIDQKIQDSTLGRVSSLSKQVKYFKEHYEVNDIGFLIVTDTQSFLNSIMIHGHASFQISKTSLINSITQRVIAVDSYLRVVNNEPEYQYSLFYPNWYPIFIDELSI